MNMPIRAVPALLYSASATDCQIGGDIFKNVAVKSFEMGVAFLLLHPFKTKGSVAEWLGRGLQNLVQRFESARNLR